MSVADRIIESIADAAPLYHRLVVVVAAVGAGKTAALREVSRRTEAPVVNVNLELSRRMLDLTARQRALQIPRLLSEILERHAMDAILLDNIEILFDVDLRQDPLRLLEALSRGKTIVAAWSGTAQGGHLVYAAPEHREYRRYAIRDFLVVGIETTSAT